MESELTRRVTLYWMLVISVVIAVLVLLQFMNNEGVWLMEVTDAKRWWSVKLTRSLNVLQIALVALVLLVLLAIAFAYERRLRYAEHAFFLLVAMVQVSTMEQQQFANTVPQSFWAPVVVAMAFTTLSWSAVVLAVQMAMVLSFWGIQGAFATPVSMIFFATLFGALATGRYLRDQEIQAARRRGVAPPKGEEGGLPSPKRPLPAAKTAPSSPLSDALSAGLQQHKSSASTPEGRAFLEQLNRRLASEAKD